MFFLAVAAARGAPGGAIFAAGQLMGLAFTAKFLSCRMALAKHDFGWKQAFPASAL